MNDYLEIVSDIIDVIKPIIILGIIVLTLIIILEYINNNPIELDCYCKDPPYGIKCKDGTEPDSDKCNIINDMNSKTLDIVKNINDLYGGSVDKIHEYANDLLKLTNNIINLLRLEINGRMISNINNKLELTGKRIGKFPSDSIHWVYHIRKRTIRSSLDPELIITVSNLNEGSDILLTRETKENLIEWEYDNIEGLLKIVDRELYFSYNNNRYVLSNKSNATRMNITNILETLQLSELMDLISTIRLPDIILDLEAIKTHIRACLSNDSLISVGGVCIPGISNIAEVPFEGKNYKCCVPVQPFKCMIKGVKEGIANGRVCLPLLRANTLNLIRFNIDTSKTFDFPGINVSQEVLRAFKPLSDFVKKLPAFILNVNFPNIEFGIRANIFGRERYSFIKFEYYNVKKNTRELRPLEYICGTISCFITIKIDITDCISYYKRFELYTINTLWEPSKDEECCCSPSIKEWINFFKDLFNKDWWESRKSSFKFDIDWKRLNILMSIPIPSVRESCPELSFLNKSIGIMNETDSNGRILLDTQKRPLCIINLDSSKLRDIFGDLRLCWDSFFTDWIKDIKFNINTKEILRLPAEIARVLPNFILNVSFPNIYFGVSMNLPNLSKGGETERKTYVLLQYSNTDDYSNINNFKFCGIIKCKMTIHIEISDCTKYHKEFELFSFDTGLRATNNGLCCCGPSIDETLNFFGTFFNIEWWQRRQNEGTGFKFDIDLKNLKLLIQLPVPSIGNTCPGLSILNRTLGVINLQRDQKLESKCAIIFDSEKLRELLGDFRLCLDIIPLEKLKNDLNIRPFNIDIGDINIVSNFPNLEIGINLLTFENIKFEKDLLDFKGLKLPEIVNGRRKNYVSFKYYNRDRNNNITELKYLCDTIICRMRVHIELNPCTIYDKEIELFSLDTLGSYTNKDNNECCCGASIDDIMKWLKDMFDVNFIRRYPAIIRVDLPNIYIEISLPKLGGRCGLNMLNGNIGVIDGGDVCKIILDTNKLRNIFGDFKICTPIPNIPDFPNILGTQLKFDRNYTNFCNRYKLDIEGPLGKLKGLPIDFSNIAQIENKNNNNCCCGPTINEINKSFDSIINCGVENLRNPLPIGILKTGKINNQCIIQGSVDRGTCCETDIGNILKNAIDKVIFNLSNAVVRGWLQNIAKNDSAMFLPDALDGIRSQNCVKQDGDRSEFRRVRMVECGGSDNQKWAFVRGHNKENPNIGKIVKLNGNYIGNTLGCWEGIANDGVSKAELCAVNPNYADEFEIIEKDGKNMIKVNKSNAIPRGTTQEYCLGVVRQNGFNNRGPYPVPCDKNDKFQNFYFLKEIDVSSNKNRYLMDIGETTRYDLPWEKRNAVRDENDKLLVDKVFTWGYGYNSTPITIIDLINNTGISLEIVDIDGIKILVSNEDGPGNYRNLRLAGPKTGPFDKLDFGSRKNAIDAIRRHYNIIPSSPNDAYDSLIKSRRRNNYCIDVPGASKNNSIDITMWDCWGGDNQKFTMDNKRRLVATHSGKCLDVANQGGSGSRIVQHDCHDGDNQKWIYDNKERLSPIYNTNICLDIQGNSENNGSRLIVQNCNNENSQKWFI